MRIVHPSLREQILSQLRIEIVSGRMAPGEPVVERKLADEFKVSSAPVREAMLQLAQEGLVELHSNRVAKVAARSAAPIRELFIPLRQTLEGYALRSVFGALGAQDFDHWEELAGRLRDAAAQGDFGRVAELDFQWHDVMVAGVEDVEVLRAWRALAAPSRIYPSRLAQQPAAGQWIYEQHARVVLYCRRGALEEAVAALQHNIASELAMG